MSTLPLPEMKREEEKPEPPLTAEGLLRRRALQRPDGAALFDPPNRAQLGLRHARNYTYREADAAVNALAAFFIEIGLEPGDRIAVQLPNLALQPLVLLAAWRAGLTVAVLPMLWRGYEVGRVCEAIEPKALIGVSSFAGARQCEELCRVAAPHLSVRFVLGFGQDLPDGVASLDEAILGYEASRRAIEAPPRKGPALINFTARAGTPLVPIFRSEDELLALGAMTVLALALDSRDVILNPYPLTGPVGLSLGLASWLISGAVLAQHQPFDYAAFVQQMLSTGATVTALPSPILAELAKDGVLHDPKCGLRRLCAVWSTYEHTLPLSLGTGALLFDFYPLGDLASVVLRRETRTRHSPLPLGPVKVGEDGDGAVFVETRLERGEAATGDGAGGGEILLRGPVVPRGAAYGPLARDADGFVATGLRAEIEAGVAPSLHIVRDPELLHHGGAAIAASELDGLYQAYPGFLDAACFALPDPLLCDRIFAAVSPKPGEAVSLETLIEFLDDRQVAPYKFPDKLLVVKEIPRDASGRILREQILQQV